MTYRVIVGNSLEKLKELEDKSVQCVITSPPYWQKRDYGNDEQIGLEDSPWEFIDKMVLVFKEIYRVLKDDGIVWLNIDDSYTVSGKNGGQSNTTKWKQASNVGSQIKPQNKVPEGLKRKELCLVPHRLAIRMQEEIGFYLRTDIIWHKLAAMPDSVLDRPSRNHEYIFLFSKSDTYFYDIEKTMKLNKSGEKVRLRTVWDVNKSMGFNDGTSHYATYPKELIIPCLLSGSREGDTILDPFNGSGTTGVVAIENKRNYIGIELNPEYAKMSEDRLKNTQAKTSFTEDLFED